MEENTSEMRQDDLNQGPTSENITCKGCGSMDIERGYVLPLCSKCRTELSRIRIPLWIKLAFALVAVLVVVALSRFPQSMRGGIEYERAIRAENLNKHVTALKHYQNAVEIYPDSTLALARLYISYFNNERISEAVQTLDSIAGREVKSEWLYNDVQKATERMTALYFPDEGFIKLLETGKEKKTQDLAAELQEYNKTNPDNVFAAYYYSNMLFNNGKYDEAEEVITKIMASNKDFYRGYILLAAICRETGRFDKGIEYCDEVIKYNVENASAYSAKARLELKRHNDKAGLEFALRSLELELDQTYALSTLAMAYHYNNMMDERDKAFEEFKLKAPEDEYNIQLLTGIFDGKLSWRD